MESKIMIVDDEAIIAEDIADLCEDIGFTAVFVAYRAGQAIDYLKNNPVDLVLLDINLGESIDGVDIAEFINQECTARTIFISSYSDQQTLARVTKTNPAGYIVKPFNKEQLLSTIILALNKPKKTNRLLELEALNKKLHQPLTAREYEILSFVIKGNNNAEIAKKCFLSINTIKYHLKQLHAKVEVKSRLELISYIDHLN